MPPATRCAIDTLEPTRIACKVIITAHGPCACEDRWRALDSGSRKIFSRDSTSHSLTSLRCYQRVTLKPLANPEGT